MAIILRCMVCALVFGAAGCMTTQDSVNVNQSLMSLQTQIQNQEARLQALERQAQGGQQAPGGGKPRNLADLYARQDEMQVRLGRMQGTIEELQRRSGEARPATGGDLQPLIPVPGAPQSPQQQAAASGQPKPPGPAISIPESDTSEKGMYDRAVAAQQAGRHEEARRGYQGLLAKYPSSQYAEAATFRIAETYTAEKKHREAVEAYQQYLDKYPKSRDAPTALLKQGMAWQALGDKTAARILYQRLIERYPESPSAQLAKKSLQELR